MNREQFDSFLLAVAAISALGVIVNLMLVKRRGTSGFVLAGAFGVMALGTMAYRGGAGLPVAIILGVCVILLLGFDFGLRASKQTRGPK